MFDSSPDIAARIHKIIYIEGVPTTDVCQEVFGRHASRIGVDGAAG